MNWGNKLLATFIVFAAGMGFLVFRSVKTNFELVEKDYYKSEIRYQQVIDGANRANQLSKPVELVETKEGIVLTLPNEMKGRSITGKMWFYCSYDKGNDRKFDLQVNSEGVQLIGPGKVGPASYTVKINWECDGVNYFVEKYITVS